MLFNSIDFAIFLPIAFAVYWFVLKNHLRLQNGWIVAASYLFYGWWDWRFLALIIISTMTDFLIGLALGSESSKFRRKTLVWCSILVNLGMLGFFKYYNFFLENFIAGFSFLGYEISASSLNIILPVGISFYTFQTLSYTFDIYYKKIEPTRDFIAFSAFVSFFPQLVAGPIERASNLLPQFTQKREFCYESAADGLRQILWGLFKKIVIADNCAEFANQIFDQSHELNGSTLLIGAVFFAFQIYGDFSGYSDIAIGTARLFGFNLMQNFAYPYFSRNIAEFWRRWHISLSTWFRDYLYIPLGGSRGGRGKVIRNVFIIFLVSGFWHGANWTFIIWGALNALYFLPLLLTENNRNYLGVAAEGKLFPTIKETFFMAGTFGITVLAWIFFRAENLTHALQYLDGMFSASLLSVPDIDGKMEILLRMGWIVLFMMVEWLGRESKYAIESIGDRFSIGARWVIYLVIILIIYFFGNTELSIEFIYFQF
jgi:alginate O-acetyltransferase complex protein AlgI